MLEALLAFLILAAQAVSAATPPKPDWKAFADCAAAYRANAAIPDPDRPASMKAMVNEVAGDYETAARSRYREQFGRTEARASRDVAARVSAKARAFGRKPRTEVEKIIDACPQTGG